VIDAGTAAQPPLFLVPRADRGKAIIVETRRPPREVNLAILGADELERTPGTFGDPVRAIESQPNVARPKLLEGALVVRGAEPANTAVLLDGHPVPFLFHFNFWKSVVNPAFVESTRFYPGGMPSSYGNVLQAVLDVRTKDVALDRVHGAADVNLTDTSLMLTAPLFRGKASIAGAYRFSYLGLIILGLEALANAASGSSERLFIRYSDYQLRLDAPWPAAGSPRCSSGRRTASPPTRTAGSPRKRRRRTTSSGASPTAPASTTSTSTTGRARAPTSSCTAPRCWAGRTRSRCCPSPRTTWSTCWRCPASPGSWPASALRRPGTRGRGSPASPGSMPGSLEPGSATSPTCTATRRIRCRPPR
jgi:hypothetical protein